MDTWVPLLLAAGHDVQVFDGVRLGVADDYESLSIKTKALCQWALETGYGRMLKLDDDANIRLARFEAVSWDYAGIRMPGHDGWPHAYASGGAYWLSEAGLRIVAGHTPYDWGEDRWVGKLMAEAGRSLQEISSYVIWNAEDARFSVRQGKVDENSAVVTQLSTDGQSDIENMLACHRQWGRT